MERNLRLQVFQKAGTHSVLNKKKRTKIDYSIYIYSVIFQQNNVLSLFDLQKIMFGNTKDCKNEKKQKQKNLYCLNMWLQPLTYTENEPLSKMSYHLYAN